MVTALFLHSLPVHYSLLLTGWNWFLIFSGHSSSLAVLLLLTIFSTSFLQIAHELCFKGCTSYLHGGDDFTVRTYVQTHQIVYTNHIQFFWFINYTSIKAITKQRDKCFYARKNRIWLSGMSLWLPGLEGREGGDGIVREFGIHVYTLLYFKWITSKDLPYSTWNAARCYAAVWMGQEFGGEWVHVCVWLSALSAYPKLSQHGIPQYKKKKRIWCAGDRVSVTGLNKWIINRTRYQPLVN